MIHRTSTGTAHTSALSRFFQDTQKAKSQQPFKIRTYRPDEEVYILLVSQSRTDPHILPETFTQRFGPRCQNDHFGANWHFSCNRMWFQSTDVPIFSLPPFVLKQKRQRSLLCADITDNKSKPQSLNSFSPKWSLNITARVIQLFMCWFCSSLPPESLILQTYFTVNNRLELL